MKKVIKIILLLMCLAGVVGIGISVANSFEKDDATQGHIHKYEDVVVEATCTTDGYSVKECACGKSLGEKTVIKATGHSWGDWIINKEATCTEAGSKHKECASCGDISRVAIAPTGHTYKPFEKDPTCTEDGYIEYVCAECLASYIGEVLPRTGHSESDWIIDKEATCTEAGSKHKECNDCETILATESILATGHNCSWKSFNEYGWRNVCNICGDCVESWEVDLAISAVYFKHTNGVSGQDYIASTTSQTGYPEERKEVIVLQAAQYKKSNGETPYFYLAVESAENCTAILTQDNSTGCYTLTITNVTGNATVVIGQAEA